MMEGICLCRNGLQVNILIGGIGSIKLPDTSFLHNSLLLACNFARQTARAKILSDVICASHFVAFGKIK